MAFDDLEKREHKSFLQKHYAGARANIEQKPYGASLRRTMREWSKKLCTSFKGGGAWVASDSISVKKNSEIITRNRPHLLA